MKEKFGEFGKIERAKKVKDYGFIHFEDRDDAIKAMQAMNGQVHTKCRFCGEEPDEKFRKFLLKIVCLNIFRKLESWRSRSRLPSHHQRTRKRNSASVNRRGSRWWWPWDEEEVHSECLLFVTSELPPLTVSGIAWWMTVMPTGQTVKKWSFLCQKRFPYLGLIFQDIEWTLTSFHP